MVKTCECCGHPLPEISVQLGLTYRERAIFVAVQKAGKAGILVSSLIERVYGDDIDGGPITAANSIYVHRRKMREKLAEHGLQIITTKGHGSLWRLEAIQ